MHQLWGHFYRVDGLCAKKEGVSTQSQSVLTAHLSPRVLGALDKSK